MSECSNCGRWRIDKVFVTTGLCLWSDEYTSSHYVCNRHEPAAVAKPVILRRQSEVEDALVKAMKEFDAEKAADRVMKSGITIDIITVQGFLRCSYGKAAAVIELLKSQGRIR
jgi:hypothetical protein